MSVPSLDPRRPVSPARIVRLGDEQGDDLSSTTTAEERIAMVAVLFRRMWELRGWSLPSYTRAEMPGRVIRPS